MILRTLKSNGPLNLILYFFIGVLFWMRNLLTPELYPYFDDENKNILFNPLDKIFQNLPLFQVILSLLLVLFIAFIVQQISNRYALINLKTRLPVAVYIIVVGGITPMHTLHPVFFAAVFTLLGINSLFSIFNNPEPRLDIFNAGLLVAIGTLFCFNNLVIFPAFLLAISTLRRERNWREFLIFVIGFVIPFLFALSYSFFTDQLAETFEIFRKNIVTPVNHFKTNYPLQGFLALLIALTIIGSFKILQQYDSRKVSTRKYYQIFFIIFVFTMFSFVFIPATSLEMLVISVIPVTFLISNLFVSIKSGFWRELLFILLLGTAIFMQFADKLFINGY